MSAAHYFAEHAERLAGYGYDVIPISRHDDRRMVLRKGEMVPLYACPGKQPAQSRGWQKGCPVAAWPAFADCGVGILTETCPAIDIDVLDQGIAEALQGVADKVLGDAPIRVGRAPKRLMPFQLYGEPFPKLKVSWRGIGDEFHEPTKPPVVEVLTAGQQYVALGVHPDTGRPYQWHRDPDLSLPRGMLPHLDRDKAERFIKAVAGAVKRLGATDIKVSGARQTCSGKYQRTASNKPNDVDRIGHPAAELLGKVQPSKRQWATSCPNHTVADDIRSALERQGNHDLDYDEWIKLGHAIKAALPGPEGLSIWEWWSSLSGKNNPDLTARKWATFNPERVTAATIFWGCRR